MNHGHQKWKSTSKDGKPKPYLIQLAHGLGLVLFIIAAMAGASIVGEMVK